MTTAVVKMSSRVSCFLVNFFKTQSIALEMNCVDTGLREDAPFVMITTDLGKGVTCCKTLWASAQYRSASKLPTGKKGRACGPASGRLRGGREECVPAHDTNYRGTRSLRGHSSQCRHTVRSSVRRVQEGWLGPCGTRRTGRVRLKGERPGRLRIRFLHDRLRSPPGVHTDRHYLSPVPLHLGNLLYRRGQGRVTLAIAVIDS